MQGKRIVLGIGGGIAAYKTPALVRQLVAAGMDVIPVMTESANHFVTATVLTTLSGNRVRNDLWDLEAERSMGQKTLLSRATQRTRGGQRLVYDVLCSRPPDFHSYE